MSRDTSFLVLLHRNGNIKQRSHNTSRDSLTNPSGATSRCYIIFDLFMHAYIYIYIYIYTGLLGKTAVLGLYWVQIEERIYSSVASWRTFSEPHTRSLQTSRQ